MTLSTRLAALLLLGSGCAALVYQTAWERMLRLVFGASHSASTAVLAIFLGGLGLGGAWLGKRAEKSARPLVLYGNLELGVALTAALTPFLVDGIAQVYWALGGREALGPAGATAARVTLAALVLGPSVVMMGGTLPAIARAAESEHDVARGRLATLYAANTLGAVLGALLGTFLLFELFGARIALWVAVLLNLLVALAARALGRQLAPVPVASASDRPAAAADDAREPSPRVTRLVYGAAAVVGFAFLGLEVLWYRMLAAPLGGTRFTFGLVLAVALAGIGIGGYLYSRRDESRPATLSLLAFTILLEALLVGVPLAMGDGVALLATFTRSWATLGFWQLSTSWTLVTALVVLPGAVVAGYQFPVLFALLGRGRRNIARQVGLTYAFNTAGSIAGALLVGFLLVPALGTVLTWKVLVAVLVVLAAVVLAVALAERQAGATQLDARAALRLAIPFALCAWPLWSAGPSAYSRHAPIGAGRVDLPTDGRNGVIALINHQNAITLWERDGVESTVGVQASNGLAFVVNGKSDGAVVNDRGTQALLGLLPALLHERPKTAFVIGLGTGMTAGWLAAVDTIERVDVAELEPAILEVAKASSPVNHDALANPKLKLFLSDGRELMLTQKRKFDLIVSEPSNPYRAGVASLFTKEFYQVAASRLESGGLFAQWVQGYEIDAQTLRIVFATLRSVFAAVEAWQTQSGDFLLLASEAPRVHDVDELRRRVAREPYRTGLPRNGLIEGAEGVLSRFTATAELVSHIARTFDPPINTDDTLVLEYAFAQSLGRSGPLAADLTALALRQGMARPAVRGQVDWGLVDELRPRMWLVSGNTPPAGDLRDPAARARADAVSAGCLGDLSGAHREWSRQQRAPLDVVEMYVVGQGLAQQREAEALRWAKELAKRGYLVESHVITARYRSGMKDQRGAFAELEAALIALRTSDLPLCDAAAQAVYLSTFVAEREPALKVPVIELLLASPFSVHIVEERRLQAAQSLAFGVDDPALCVRALGRHLQHPRWVQAFLLDRARCLQRAGHPLAERAADDVVRFATYSLGDITSGLELPPPPPPPMPAAAAGDAADAAEATAPDADAVEDAGGQ